MLSETEAVGARGLAKAECNNFLACFAILEHQINSLFTSSCHFPYLYALGETINFLQGGFSGWKRLLGTRGKKGSEQRGEKLYLKNLSGSPASLDIFPSRVEISTSPKKQESNGIKIQIYSMQTIEMLSAPSAMTICASSSRAIFAANTTDIFPLTLREKGGNISSINFRLILLDSTEMDVDGEHEYYEMETDAFLRPRGRVTFDIRAESSLRNGRPYRLSFHVERCPQGGHLYVLRGSFDGLAGFAVPETDTKGEPQRTRMDAPLTRTQKTDTRSLQKLLINTDDEYTKPQCRAKNFGTKAREEHCCRILLRGRNALREQDGVTEKQEKRGVGEKGKRRLDRERVREGAREERSGRILGWTERAGTGDGEGGGDLSLANGALATEHRVENEKTIRLVEIAGKQRRTITPSYPEDVTRAGTVASTGSRVNVSRGKARRKLCREGSRLGAWNARKIWDGRGITGRKSQDNRNEIRPTVKNVGFLKVNKGRTAEESWIRRQIIVCTIEWLSLSLRVEKTTRSRADSVEQKKKEDFRTRSDRENKREILSTSKEINRDVRLSEAGPKVTPFQIDPSIEPARVARCDGGVKCAVITGGRRKAGKKVVNMTPIFLVVLLAIDPIIAQNTGSYDRGEMLAAQSLRGNLSPQSVIRRALR
ncbi:hypothetical protein G5I_10748 [Acromyrmex echinatior]|uniref:Uncharacterized protein n=1 Tax=Acromyrmex echinatior TaxID=103372 RepID=F4WXQ8_ACREC|nr:hypothetical protein G5I_10748 [Acromyrmex echinatior]